MYVCMCDIHTFSAAESKVSRERGGFYHLYKGATCAGGGA